MAKNFLSSHLKEIPKLYEKVYYIILALLIVPYFNLKYSVVRHFGYLLPIRMIHHKWDTQFYIFTKD